MKSRALTYFALILAFAVYSCASVCSKWASAAAFLSPDYILRLSAAVVILFIYALAWQQIIKRIPVSDAFMFKGLTLVFILLMSHFIFGEEIATTNIIGAGVIVLGIAIYAKA